MSDPTIQNGSEKPTCEWCGAPLETAVTVDNPLAKIQANSLARCPSCLLLIVIGADLRPYPDLPDEAAFDAAWNANPEISEWARKTQEIARVRSAAETRAKCRIAREWLVARGGPDLVGDLAALAAHAAGFDEQGFTRASIDVRHRAAHILSQLSRQMRQRALVG